MPRSKATKPKLESKTWPLNEIVEIEWVDTNTYGKWAGIGDYKRTLNVSPCKTIGYLVRKDAKEILVVTTQSGDNDGDAIQGMAIPIGCVSKITPLATR